MASPSVANPHLERFKVFLREKEGSTLRAWLKYFDPELELRVTALQFSNAVRNMGFPDDPQALFAGIDVDRSGEMAIEEIDELQATVWRSFREWCATTFENAKDMVHRLQAAKPIHGSIITERILHAQSWREGLQRLGWELGSEDLLFHALDSTDQKQLSVNDLRWLDIEKRRRRRKEQAKQRAAQEMRRNAGQNQAVANAALEKFKRHLKHMYGNYIRAWRCALSPNDLMVVQKIQFSKACADLGFRSEVKLIWRALGKDGLGNLSLDELDSKSALVLAHFQVLVEQQLGGSAAAFRFLDAKNVRKVRELEFSRALQGLGFQQPTKLLFEGLARSAAKFIVEEDLRFLDRWKPPAFLIVSPNPQARDEIKAALLNKYGYSLKAWRRALDLDSSNRCTWAEFHSACKKLGYGGDIAGAWRALDADMSGYITLHEIDPESCNALLAFRKWADEEFGSVKSAYMVFDDDGSNNVTSREFRRACRLYGFEGGAMTIFRALDVEGVGALSRDEVIFLDEWEFLDNNEDTADAQGALSRHISSRTEHLTPRRGESMESRKEGGDMREASPGILAAASAQPDIAPCTPGPATRARTPRFTADPERMWWTDVPLRRSPSPGPASDRPASSLAAWCSLCRARGSCRHICDARSARPSPPPCTWRPFDSMDGGCVATVFPTTLDAGLRADRTCRQRYHALHSARRPLLPPSAVPPRAASALGAARHEEALSDLGVQVMAINQYPMGTVSAAQALASLRVARAMAPTEKVFGRSPGVDLRPSGVRE